MDETARILSAFHAATLPLVAAFQRDGARFWRDLIHALTEDTPLPPPDPEKHRELDEQRRPVLN